MMEARRGEIADSASMPMRPHQEQYEPMERPSGGRPLVGPDHTAPLGREI